MGILAGNSRCYAQLGRSLKLLPGIQALGPAVMGLVASLCYDVFVDTRLYILIMHRTSNSAQTLSPAGWPSAALRVELTLDVCA